MDLPLWDSSDDQGYLTSFAYGSANNTEDHLLHDSSFVHGRDMLEEDALNEKSCLKVLKIWIDKADEDIVKLEEDILMLKCQLLWDDEDWAEQCSAVLRDKIDHLDNRIQSLKENTENGPRVENEDLPPRLHDLLKPLLENYTAKPKQTESSTLQIPVSTVELNKKESKHSITEENVCTVLQTYERKSKSTELEEREINHPQNKQNAVATEFNASAHMCTNGEVSENFISKQITLDVLAVRERSPDKSEPANSMVEESSASTSIEKVNSRENQKMRNIEEIEEKSDHHSKALSKAGVIPGRLQDQSKVTPSHLKLNATGSEISETVKVDSVKPRTEGSSKEQKARVYRRATKGDVLSVKPSVKMEGQNTKLSETLEAVEALQTEMNKNPCSMIDRTGHVKMLRMELEHQVQVQHRRDIAAAAVNQAHELISPLIPEGRGPQKKCKENPEAAEALQTEMNRSPFSLNDRAEHIKRPRLELEHQVQVQQGRNILNMVANQAKLISPLQTEGRGPQIKFQEIPEILQNSFEAEHVEKGPSYTENLIEQGKKGAVEGMSMNRKETQQKLNEIHLAGTSVATATPILLPQEVRRLSFNPQTESKKEDPTSSGMELAKKEHGASNSTAEETTDGVKNISQASSPCAKNDKVKLTCSYLKAIAKSRNLQGYSKLKKEELQKLLGFS